MSMKKLATLLVILFTASSFVSATQVVERTASSDDISVQLERTPSNYIKIQVKHFVEGIIPGDGEDTSTKTVIGREK